MTFLISALIFPFLMSKLPTADNRRMFIFLLALAATTAFGVQGWRSLITNFAVERAGLGGFEMGVLQSVREIPGLLSLLVVFLLLLSSERRLAAMSVAVLGVGVAMTGYLPSFAGIAVSTLVMSFGFHYFETVNKSLTLQYFNIAEAPIVAGRVRSAASAANIAGAGVIFVLTFFLDYTSMFLAVGAAVVLIGCAGLFFDPTDKNLPPQHKKMVFRWKYWLYYALTFFAGARRQIFIAFALFLLVKKFGFPVKTITTLFIVNNVILFFISPAIGRAIARFGERIILTVEYAGLILIFLIYAYSDSVVFVTIAYVVDHVLFSFAIAISTYFQKIADKKDIAPSMAVGFTINHIAAVVIPVLGGLMWISNQRLVFVGGAALAACSLILCLFIPSHKKLTARSR